MKRDIYIGDIHGCLDELLALLDQLDVQPEDRVISLGDLVDRGPDSAGVWRFFRDRPNSVAIMGNHERKHVRGVLSFSQEIVKYQMGEEYEALREWAAKLPYHFETEHCVAVHGGFDPRVPLAEQRPEVLSGTTSGLKRLSKDSSTYWPERYGGTKPILFGHHVVGEQAVRFGSRVWGLDTGACHGGYLTAMVVPGFTVHRVPVKVDHWRLEK